MVGLVEDDDLDIVQDRGAAFDEVLQPAGRGDDEVDPAIERGQLRWIRHTAGHDLLADSDRAGDRLERIGHLQRQLARRHQNDRARPVRRGLALAQPGQRRQPEGHRLAGPGLAAAEQILGREGVGDRRRLDREGRADAPGGERVDDRVRQTELAETGPVVLRGSRGRRGGGDRLGRPLPTRAVLADRSRLVVRPVGIAADRPARGPRVIPTSLVAVAVCGPVVARPAIAVAIARATLVAVPVCRPVVARPAIAVAIARATLVAVPVCRPIIPAAPVPVAAVAFAIARAVVPISIARAPVVAALVCRAVACSAVVAIAGPFVPVAIARPAIIAVSSRRSIVPVPVGRAPVVTVGGTVTTTAVVPAAIARAVLPIAVGGSLVAVTVCGPLTPASVLTIPIARPVVAVPVGRTPIIPAAI